MSGGTGWSRAGALESPWQDGRSAGAAVRLDPSWRQGPGIYGGLTGATLARVGASLAGERPLRTMSLQYCAPVLPGEARAEAVVERAGASSTFVAAKLLQQGSVQVSALMCFARDRSSDLDHADLAPPDRLPSPDSLPSIPFLEGVTPEFTRHVEFRFPELRMFSGGGRARSAAWLRFREAGPGPVDRPMLVGLLDAMPPALLVRADRPRAMSTVSFQLHLLPDVERLALPPDTWLHAEIRSDLTRRGWSDEEIVLSWPAAPDPGDRVLAIGRQLVALLR